MVNFKLYYVIRFMRWFLKDLKEHLYDDFYDDIAPSNAKQYKHSAY